MNGDKPKGLWNKARPELHEGYHYRESLDEATHNSNADRTSEVAKFYEDIMRIKPGGDRLLTDIFQLDRGSNHELVDANQGDIDEK